MDFAPTDEQDAIFEMALQFGAERIAPFARDWETAGTIPRAILEEAGALGFGGIYVSQEHGGSGLSRLDGTLIFEALSQACPSVAAFISIHNMCAWMIDRFGSETQRSEWLPGLCAMTSLCSYCLTEPGAGSDASAIRTAARADGNVWTLNGTKSFISGAGLSDHYIVMCRTGEAGPKGISTFVVPVTAEGLGFGAPEDKMGWRAQPTAEVLFTDCLIGDSQRLGSLGAGFTYAMTALDGGRLNIAATALGGAQWTLNQTIRYMGERHAFGKTLDQFQALQFQIADMEISLQSARVFLRNAAWKLDHGVPDASTFCAMAKRYVTNAAFSVANSALQLHGGYGYLADYGIEKVVRDLRVHQILEGTNEIMSLITARALLKGNK